MNTQKVLSLLLGFLLAGCNNGSSNNSNNNQDLGSNNVTPLIVDSGYNNTATNRPFITITICQTNTTNCQIIDHVMVDTGSTGLRINQSALRLNLTPVTYQNNNLYQCMQYAAGYGFGQIMSADLKIAGETASNIPIQIFNDQNQNNVPEQCSNGMEFADLNKLGAHAIIGVNPYSNPNNSYTNGGVYTCLLVDDCSIIADPTLIPTQLNLNPVTAFYKDNNGLILDLPTANMTTTTPLIGSLIFGLNTESNNLVNNNTVTTITGNPESSFPVGYFNSDTGSLTNTIAIFDSGTPLYSFYYTGINQCTGTLEGLYCPNPSPQTWNSIITGYNSATPTTINASIINYSTIPDSTNNAVVPGLSEVSDSTDNLTIYGLTYFFGKKIYLGLMGESGNVTPLGIGPAWGIEEN